ncbi:hypothetical protein QQS21_000828 [Conoideocrella luteorostrata]|uniref:Uncharacterized protein n=1 Tax=Conoideocrella luteorostrata TaxID=1105319 RepID=A0AAJ0D0H3_9HYPO|nr:hypothetical protein QQS21_000828 [Conoideocrella luteorostrata]
MKIVAVLVFAISGLALAVQPMNPEIRAATAPQKDNRNLKYLHNVPLAKSYEEIKKEHESS